MKLSIITINFNNLEGLKKTFKSVVNQTFDDYEWIIIDGGSTDGSKEFIEANQEKFSYWVSESDRGIYHAMNKGIRQAHGDYISFMNSGDYYAYRSTLANVFATNREADILFGYMINECLRNIYSPEAMTNNIPWFHLYSTTIPHQSAFIRRSLFERVGMYDDSFKITGDCKFFMDAIICHRASYEFIPILVAIFDGNGISSQNDLTEERSRQKEGVFPYYISDQDVSTLREREDVKNSMVGNFLYNIALAISLQQRRVRSLLNLLRFRRSLRLSKDRALN